MARRDGGSRSYEGLTALCVVMTLAQAWFEGSFAGPRLVTLGTELARHGAGQLERVTRGEDVLGEIRSRP